MNYHGNNPIGLALATDPQGQLRDELLRSLDAYRSAAEDAMKSSSTPAVYQRHLAAVQCAAACVAVVKEFHAICSPAEAEQAG
jgi:hypothetical protein